MASKWTTDIAGFSFLSPSPRILVKEAMTSIINAIYERDDPNIKNGSINYTSIQLSDANFIMQEFIDKCVSCFGKYLNLNLSQGGSTYGNFHTWDYSSSAVGLEDGFVEIGLYNGEDYSFFSNFNQQGYFLEEAILRKCFNIISALKWRIGEQGCSRNSRATNLGSGIFINKVKDVYDDMYNKTAGVTASHFPDDVYRNSTNFWNDAENAIQQNYQGEFEPRYRYAIGVQAYNQSLNYLGAASFISGMDTKSVFNTSPWTTGGLYNPMGSAYLNSQVNIHSSNEKAGHYSYPCLVDVTPSLYNAEIDSIPFPSDSDGPWYSCSLKQFQMFFNVDDVAILEYYTP